MRIAALLCWFRAGRTTPRTAPRPRRLAVEVLEDRTVPSTLPLAEIEPNDIAADAQLLSPSSIIAAATYPGDVDVYRVRLTEDGRLTIRVEGDNFRTRLTLRDAAGRLLAQDEGALSDPGSLLTQHPRGITDGTDYLLEIVGLGGADDYTLSTTFEPSVMPFQPLPTGTFPTAFLARDLDGDGRPDLLAVNENSKDLSLFLGLGDGTFRALARLPLPGAFSAAEVDDFDRDGLPDLAVAVVTTAATDRVAIFRGMGSGEFHDAIFFDVGTRPSDLFAIDLNGDALPDLVTGNTASTDVSVLLNDGAGGFQPQRRFSALGRPLAVTAADFDGDDVPDLAIVNNNSGEVVVLPGAGNGDFGAAARFRVGSLPRDILSGDFNGDGLPDLATANRGSADVSILLGVPGGGFRPEVRSPKIEGSSVTFAADDLNRDGKLDLVVISDITALPGYTVLLGNGDGSLRSLGHARPGGVPTLAVPADFDGDGVPDLAVARSTANDVLVLPGLGDGTFPSPGPIPTGGQPASLAVGDFNRDGQPDVATANGDTGEVGVLLALGDGGVALRQRTDLDDSPAALVEGDFNGDDRPDLVVASAFRPTVRVLLGRGDGGFVPQAALDVGATPLSLAAADLDRDGRLDLVIARRLSPLDGTSDVMVLLGVGDGTFRLAGRSAVGNTPQAVLAADLDGDLLPDLATANLNSGDISVLYSRGGGVFDAERRFRVGSGPVAIVAADFDRDGRPDLATADQIGGSVSVLFGRAGGTFTEAVSFAAGRFPLGLAAADFDGDGAPDLAATNSLDDTVTVLVNDGRGVFVAAATIPVGKAPRAVRADDFNADGRADLVIANFGSSEVTILLGVGDGNFLDASTAGGVFVTSPVLADLTGDGADDVVVVDRRGRILFRRRDARAARPEDLFDPPTVVNLDDPQTAARDVAVVRTPSGLLLAALEPRRSGLAFYTRLPNGTFLRSEGPSVPASLPVRLVSGDLDGDGLDDLVALTAGAGEAFVYLQSPSGGFGRAPDFTLDTGSAPSDVTLTDLDGDGRLDVVVLNRRESSVSVFLNAASAPFADVRRYRAAEGPFGLEERGGFVSPLSWAGGLGLVAGRFDGDGLSDLVITLDGRRQLSLLRGAGGGGFMRPEPTSLLTTGVRPTVAVAGHFDGDAHLDLAVLEEGGGTVSFFRGDGRGGFTFLGSATVGEAMSGLAVAQLTDDAVPDLLLNNAAGDVLVLVGDGDGSFRVPAAPPGASVPFAAGDLNGDGLPDVVAAREATGELSLRLRVPGTNDFIAAELASGTVEPLTNPAGVALADLDGRDGLDLVVANTGGNSVLVYLRQPDGRLATRPLSFAVGTNPVSLTVDDLNADGTLDVAVANRGSNDVSVLFGGGVGATWSFAAGPRLAVGSGPIGVSVAEETGDGVPDLLVTDGGSGGLSIVPGIGSDGRGTGFFADAARVAVSLPAAPVQPIVDGFAAVVAGLIVEVTRTFGVPVARTVFAPIDGRAALFVRPVTLTTRPGPALVAARGDGSVSLLVRDGDRFVETDVFRSPGLLRPGALEVLTLPDRLEVYVIDETSGEPVAFLLERFPSVFGGVGPLALPLLLLFPAEGFGGERPTVAGLLSTGSGGLAVFAALLPGTSLTEDAQAGGDAELAANDGQDVEVVAEEVAEDGDEATPDGGGGGEESNLDERPPEEAPATPSGTNALSSLPEVTRAVLDDAEPRAKEDPPTTDGDEEPKPTDTAPKVAPVPPALAPSEPEATPAPAAPPTRTSAVSDGAGVGAVLVGLAVVRAVRPRRGRRPARPLGERGDVGGC